MEAQLSAGIVRLQAANLNIPEADCCGEAVEVALIPLIAEENPAVRSSLFRCHAERRIIGRLRPIIRSRSTPTFIAVLNPRIPVLAQVQPLRIHGLDQPQSFSPAASP